MVIELSFPGLDKTGNACVPAEVVANLPDKVIIKRERDQGSWGKDGVHVADVLDDRAGFVRRGGGEYGLEPRPGQQRRNGKDDQLHDEFMYLEFGFQGKLDDEAQAADQQGRDGAEVCDLDNVQMNTGNDVLSIDRARYDKRDKQDEQNDKVLFHGGFSFSVLSIVSPISMPKSVNLFNGVGSPFLTSTAPSMCVSATMCLWFIYPALDSSMQAPGSMA